MGICQAQAPRCGLSWQGAAVDLRSIKKVSEGGSPFFARKSSMGPRTGNYGPRMAKRIWTSAV